MTGHPSCADADAALISYFCEMNMGLRTYAMPVSVGDTWRNSSILISEEGEKLVVEFALFNKLIRIKEKEYTYQDARWPYRKKYVYTAKGAELMNDYLALQAL